MKKEKIFSKFNTRSYNNEVEEVLSQKTFSEIAKNNILNMIYKIEEAYDDYKIVKIEIEDKKDFLDRILNLIKVYCNSIQILTPNEMKEKKYVINYEKGIINTIPNNTWILYAILMSSKKNKSYKSEIDVIEKKSTFDFLQQGYNINSTEVIRDFNGWSWTNSFEEIENINSNIVYQNLLILLGYTTLQNIIKSELNVKSEFIQKLENALKRKYNQQNSEKIIEKLKRIAIIETANSNDEYRQTLLEIRQNKQEEFNIMENKREFLKEISNEKKANIKKIRKIDEIINDKELLKEEYKLRNSVLRNNEKIFSISHLVEILKAERKGVLERISQINILMEPKVYVERKENIRNIIDMLAINETRQTSNNENILEMQKLFIEVFIEKIDTTLEKDDIINAIYEVRYYINLAYNSTSIVKDIVKLNSNIKKLKEKVIEKALEYKILFRFSENEELNKKILMNILETKIIDLQTIFVNITKEEKQIKLEIYDEENELNTIKNILIENIENIEIKLNKKMKLFI